MAARISVTLDEYAARYGMPSDSSRVSVLLSDACDMLLTAYEGRWGYYVEGSHPAFDRGYKAVACAVVNRAMSVPDCFAGATQYSQTAGSYNASVTYGSAMGEMYLGKADLKRLGLYGSLVRELRPMLEVEDGLSDNP